MVPSVQCISLFILKEELGVRHRLTLSLAILPMVKIGNALGDGYGGEGGHKAGAMGTGSFIFVASWLLGSSKVCVCVSSFGNVFQVLTLCQGAIQN